MFRVFFFLLYCTVFSSFGYAYKIVASIPPVASLVRAIAGENVSLDLLVDNSVSPHVYSLKPSDLRKLDAADVVFWIGPGYEAFLSKTLGNYEQKSVELMQAPGVQIYPLRSLDGHEGGCPDCASDSLAQDGHIWLDPDNGFHMAEEITKHLIRLDPVQQEKYENRLQKMKESLEKTKKEIQSQLKPYEDQGFLTLHDGYQYFEKAFHLKAGQAMSLIPDVSPSAKRLFFLKDLVRSNNIQCLFAESQFSPRLVKTLSEETRVRIGMLDPLGTSQMTYEELLLSLAKSFSACLGKPS